MARLFRHGVGEKRRIDLRFHNHSPNKLQSLVNYIYILVVAAILVQGLKGFVIHEFIQQSATPSSQISEIWLRQISEHSV